MLVAAEAGLGGGFCHRQRGPERAVLVPAFEARFINGHLFAVHVIGLVSFQINFQSVE